MEVAPRKELLVNGILFTAIIPILIGLHFLLSKTVHDTLLFDHSEFELYTLWTSAYVHMNNGHLFRNLNGYVMAMIPTWLIFSYHYRQRVLRRMYLVYLAIFPILISLTTYGIYWYGIGIKDGVTRGFSGIVAAVFGLLFVSVLKVGYDSRGWPGVMGLLGAIVLVVMVRMLIRGGAATTDTVTLGIGGALLSLMLLIPPEQIRERRLRPKFSKQGKANTVLIAYGSAVLMYTMPGMFPLNWIRPNQVVDIFGHFAGLGYGILTGIIVILLLRSDPQSHSQWFESPTL